MDYKSAGVDVEAGRAFVQRIKASVEATHRPEVVGGLGGFGGLMRLPTGLRKPLLVSGTDGVGTKLELAQNHHCHHGVGIDLVAMCVNDVVTSGAAPLFFLDYMATGALSPTAMAEVVEGIADGCRQSGCALLGGETAEMPGFYPKGRYDLAGFCVAVVEEDELIDGRSISPGDRIIGIASSGVHSNGFSLVRKVLEKKASTKPPNTAQRTDDSSTTFSLRQRSTPHWFNNSSATPSGSMAWPTSLVGDCLKICPAVCQRAQRPKSRLKHGLDLLYFSGCRPQERFQNAIFGIRSTWESGSASSYQEKRNKLPWMFVV
jgi:hypothetical protein